MMRKFKQSLMKNQKLESLQVQGKKGEFLNLKIIKAF
jgi:hypothetical protein